MSLLSYEQLCSQVVGQFVIAERDGRKIPVEQVNSSSIDIRLGRVCLVERDAGSGVVDYRKRESLSMAAEVIDPEEGVVIYPGQFILTESEEVFRLPLDISFEYKLKSSMARIGLEHLTAGWADAGWNGSVLTLELKNMNQYHPIRIRPGDTIGQLTFFRHDPVPREKSYAARGRYNSDLTVTQTKANGTVRRHVV
jgi:dCTP deaminase